jgi:hypothetical protein
MAISARRPMASMEPQGGSGSKGTPEGACGGFWFNRNRNGLAARGEVGRGRSRVAHDRTTTVAQKRLAVFDIHSQSTLRRTTSTPIGSTRGNRRSSNPFRPVPAGRRPCARLRPQSSTRTAECQRVAVRPRRFALFFGNNGSRQNLTMRESREVNHRLWVGGEFYFGLCSVRDSRPVRSHCLGRPVALTRHFQTM